MATDVKELLLQNQEIIDSAGVLVEETRKTQKLFQENIEHTAAAIEGHNTSGKSHEDIRQQLGDMPSMITDPKVTGPTASETGVENTWTLSAVGLIPTAIVRSFDVTDDEGQVYNVLVEGETGRADFTHAFVGERNEQTYFTVRAKGDYGFNSKEVSYDLLITKHLPPNFTKLSHTLPKVISYGKTYEFKIEGIFDEDDDLTTVNVVCDDPKIKFSQKDDLVQGQPYTLTVDEDYIGPATITVVIKADDAYGLSSTFQVPIRLNGVPNVAGIIHNIPQYLTANTSNTVRVQNVLDPDGDEVTFDIASNNASIVPSKLTGIKLNEDFDINVGNLVPGTAYSLTLTFKDPYGGTNTTTISSTINVPPSASALTMTLDKEYYKAGEAGYAIFSGATDTEGQLVKINITPVSDHQDVIWSRTTNVPMDEQIPFTIADKPNRGQVAFTLTAVDASNGTDSVVKTLRINNLPTIETMECTIPPVVIPGTRGEYTVRGAIDPDGQPVSYDIVSNNPNVIVTNGTGIAAETLFTLQVPTEEQVPRGNTFPVTIRATDGVEVAETTLNIRQNQVVDISGMILTGLPERSIPKPDYQLTITGATDADGTYTYQVITDAPEELVFSKTQGIAEGEVFTLDTTRAVRGKTYSITLRCIDDVGEYRDKVVTTRINQDIQISLGHNMPPIVIPGQTYEGITFTGITDADPEDTIAVNVTATGGVVVTKTSGDGPSAVYNISIPSAELLARGSLVTVTVSCTDGYEERNAQFAFTVNQLPLASSSTYTVPPVVKPNTTYDWRFDAVTDLDVSQVLTYSVSTNTAGVSIADAVSSASGITFKATTPSDSVLPRGSKIDFTLTVSDGLESAQKTISTFVNQLPASDTISLGEVPAAVYGGAEHAWSFTISGATDNDVARDPAHSYTYKIINTDPNVTFSAIVGIPEGQPVTATFVKVAEAHPISFQAIAVDSLGDESAPKTFSTTLQPIIVTTAPSITSPQQGAEIDDTEGWTMTWTGYSSMIWQGEGVYPNN